MGDEKAQARRTNKKPEVRTRGVMNFNLDGGDAALVETAVDITLVTCSSGGCRPVDSVHG